MGARWILEEREGEIVAGGGCVGTTAVEGNLGGVGGRPSAVRISCWCPLAFVVFVFFDLGVLSSMGSAIFLFWPFPFDFPLAARLCSSSSTRLALPSAIASPSSIHWFNCSRFICLTAGLSILSVQGHGATPFSSSVELPTTASRMIRAKQWSRHTGHLGWVGCLERAREGSLVL